MHPENPHRTPYNFNRLRRANPDLNPFIFMNQHWKETIDFANPEAVFQLNKALLLHHYRLDTYALLRPHLCPAVPGRADYLYQIKNLLEDGFGRKNEQENTPLRVLDIGVGANCIYPIIGAQGLGWQMVGVDICESSVEAAQKIIAGTEGLAEKIEIRYQENNANIFNEAIKKDEFFDLTICNPPFHASAEEAQKARTRKLGNLSTNKQLTKSEKQTQNFGGKANELWCNGGEALFIKRMIKQSISHKKQVSVFTTLVSNQSHLAKLYKQLDKAKATRTTLPMTIGHKQSRVLAWTWL